MSPLPVAARRLARAAILAGVAAVTAAAASPALANNPANPYGFSAPQPSDAALDRIAASGAGYVRASFSWASLEPQPNTFSWQATDHVVAAASARGVEIVAVLGGAPAWAAPTSASPPHDPADFARFVTAVVTRYKGSVRHWILWNEPNVATSFSGTSADFIQKVLVPGAYAAHTADSMAQVVGPELSQSGPAWDRWLKDIFGQAGGAIDVFSHHVYASTEIETMRQLVGPKLPWEPKALVDVIFATGNQRPLWLTATGVPSNLLLGEGEQSRRDERLLEHLEVEPHYWVSKVFFDLTDPAGGSPTGVCRADLSPRPAYSTVQSFVAARKAAPSPWHPLEDFGGGTPAADCLKFTNHLAQAVLGRAARADEASMMQDLWNDPAHWEIEIYFLWTHEMYNERIEAVFQSYLGRAPSAAELTTYHTQMWQTGRLLTAIRAELLGGDAYYARSGGTAQGFLSSIYHDVLGRAPTAAEVASGTPLAAPGKRATLASALLFSDERATRFMNERCQHYLGRNASAAELTYLKPLLVSGSTDEPTFENDLVTTAEYRALATK